VEGDQGSANGGGPCLGGGAAATRIRAPPQHRGRRRKEEQLTQSPATDLRKGRCERSKQESPKREGSQVGKTHGEGSRLGAGKELNHFFIN
jgi:hypothetical protein